MLGVLGGCGMSIALRKLFLPIALSLAGIFAGTTPALAANHHRTWLWDDILEPPMRGPEPYNCSATHPVRAIPDFGDGLVATYTFEVGSEQHRGIRDRIDDFIQHSNHAGGNVRGARLALPKTIPLADGEITVQDNVVLSNMDDLLDRYTTVCVLNQEPPLVLKSIAYRPASLRERAEASVRESLPITPVSIADQPPESDFMPPAVAGGDYRFAISFDPARAQAGLIPMREYSRWYLDPSKVTIGSGVRLAALFLGHGRLNEMKTLADGGFDVLAIEDGGRTKTLVIDRHVLLNAEQLTDRARQVKRYWTGLRPIRLEFYPAVLGGIDALRTNQHRELKKQVAKRHGLALAEAYTELMSYLPQNEDTEPLLKTEWSKFAGRTTGPGYDAIFDVPGSAFGKLESISCEPDDALFDCKAGVTFMVAGHPKYAERALYFERHQQESGLLKLESAEMRAPAYDPLRVSAPLPAAETSVGPQTRPTIPEVHQLIAAGWVHAPASIFTGNTQDIGDQNFASGFGDYSGDLSATFGEVHCLTCTEQDSVFTCTVGVTYMRDGAPRYRQNGYQQFQRVRNADGEWKLKVYVETQIIVTDAIRGP